jgi:alanine racemase
MSGEAGASAALPPMILSANPSQEGVRVDFSRRTFLTSVAAAALVQPQKAAVGAHPTPSPVDRFDPWLEVDGTALRENARVISRLVGGRPIVAVIKNNAYGLGFSSVVSALEPLPEIVGFAVVKAAAALTLRDLGVRKPVLLMGLFPDADGPELIARDIHLSLCTLDSEQRLARATQRAGRPARAHIYLDTGMSRMGVPYHQALPWLVDVSRLKTVHVEGTFTALTEDPEFDREQLRRFNELTTAARSRGAQLGLLHAASSSAVFNLPHAHLDLVRPGIALYGAYPSDAGTERTIAELRPALRLCARVVRVERLRPGDSVSYGRRYVAQQPTWVATLPVGHADGYPRQAVNGGVVLINGRLFPAIGAVSASHTIVELGDEPRVAIGDIATFIGPDDPAIHPNAVASAMGVSVYDVLMHLNPELPKVRV